MQRSNTLGSLDKLPRVRGIFTRYRDHPLLWLKLSVALLALLSSGTGAAELNIHVWYLSRPSESLTPLSPLDVPPQDSGVAGAVLGIKDNNTTGAFLGQRYHLSVTVAAADEKLPLPSDAQFVIADVSAEELRPLAGAHPQVLFFNIGAEDDSLRASDCAANIFHVMPSRAMKADALAQYLAWKNWRRLFLVRGALPADLAWSESLRRAAKKFGLNIVAERVYEYEATSRRTDSGHMQIQKQLPAFVQGAPEHDAVIAADESNVFADYMPYRLQLPRPVAGSAGLRPLAWHPASEQWGATQLQRRFYKVAQRWMHEHDYVAWLAVRVIGELITRQRPEIAPRDVLLSDNFSVAGFKGQALTFRPWNQQLRQPLFLTDAKMLVSVSPQPGFLHQRSQLDTMGFDRQESHCLLSSDNG